MSNQNEIRIVLGSKQFAGNTDKDIWIQPPLIGDRRTMVEGDRSLTLNLTQQFETERQESSTFRVSGKITNIFKNSITGKTIYTPYKNILYYTNEVANATLNTPPNPNVPWEGYPQYDEFTFVRYSAVTGHRNFVPKSATSYNWMLNLTYPFSSDTNQAMTYTNEKFNTSINFNSSDGIPFAFDTGELNGKKIVNFYCGTKHNLKVGDWVELTIPSLPFGLNGKRAFQVYSLGDNDYKSEEKVFSINNLKIPPSQLTSGTVGTAKRINNILNSGETKSIYYIRLHKVLATHKDFNITQGGFENNPFTNKTKLEYSALTPNQTQRVSVKEGGRTFSFTLNNDVSISGLKDNNGKPLTELFLSVIERGYMGWFNPPAVNSTGQQTAIDIGWSFNFLENSVDTWWNHSSVINKDNIPVGSYEQPQGSGQIFYFNDFLSEGDVIKGDFCEYNYIEQKEYVLSTCYHKYSFNSSYFFDNSPLTFPSGYAYEPHHSIPIRVFSDYLEFGSPTNTDNIPSYAWFSKYENTFIWRDIYSYGYTDADGIGIDFPFVNGAHYPFKQVLFLQKPIRRTDIVTTTIINQPTVDDCE